MKKEYNLVDGYVYGRLWGGGEGAYPVRKMGGFSTRAELLKEAKKALKDGSLDSGMGYESLIGARLDIEEVETIERDGKEYKHREYEMEFIGKLTEKQEEFLLELI